MAEENGSGRLDRIERALERLLSDHERLSARHEHFQEEFERDMKQLLIAQVVQQAELDKLSRTAEEHTKQIEAQRQNHKFFDERLDKLVLAIGEFIRSRPAAQL